MAKKRPHYIRRDKKTFRKSDGHKKPIQYNYFAPNPQVKPVVVEEEETLLFSNSEINTIWKVTKSSIATDDDILANTKDIIVDAVSDMPIDISIKASLAEKYEEYYLETVKFHAYSEYMELMGDPEIIKKMGEISVKQYRINSEIEDEIHSLEPMSIVLETMAIHDKTKLQLNRDVRGLFETGD